VLACPKDATVIQGCSGWLLASWSHFPKALCAVLIPMD